MTIGVTVKKLKEVLDTVEPPKRLVQILVMSC